MLYMGQGRGSYPLTSPSSLHHSTNVPRLQILKCMCAKVYLNANVGLRAEERSELAFLMEPHHMTSVKRLINCGLVRI